MQVKALVLAISKPKVAHASNQWELLVLYPVKKFGRVYREKKTVFSEKLVPLHSWINISLV